jgi:hypothetical protein
MLSVRVLADRARTNALPTGRCFGPTRLGVPSRLPAADDDRWLLLGTGIVPTVISAARGEGWV